MQKSVNVLKLYRYFIEILVSYYTKTMEANVCSNVLMSFYRTCVISFG
jgi:hypothetical protein